jgi:hypothetical protein
MIGRRKKYLADSLLDAEGVGVLYPCGKLHIIGVRYGPPFFLFLSLSHVPRLEEAVQGSSEEAAL